MRDAIPDTQAFGGNALGMGYTSDHSTLKGTFMEGRIHPTRRTSGRTGKNRHSAIPNWEWGLGTAIFEEPLSRLTGNNDNPGRSRYVDPEGRGYSRPTTLSVAVTSCPG